MRHFIRSIIPIHLANQLDELPVTSSVSDIYLINLTLKIKNKNNQINPWLCSLITVNRLNCFNRQSSIRHKTINPKFHFKFIEIRWQQFCQSHWLSKTIHLWNYFCIVTIWFNVVWLVSCVVSLSFYLSSLNFTNWLVGFVRLLLVFK